MRWLTDKSGFFGFLLVLSLAALALNHYLEFFGEISPYWVYGMKGAAVVSAFALALGAMAPK
ncbi:MAG TPA: hypothetical protein VM658_17665 [bacterium]|nr:hypothetical protein [bacterium]